MSKALQQLAKSMIRFAVACSTCIIIYVIVTGAFMSQVKQFSADHTFYLLAREHILIAAWW